MDELTVIGHECAMPWPAGNAQNQQVKGLRPVYLRPAIRKPRLHRLRHATLIVGRRVGVSVIGQRDAALGHEDGAHEAPAVIGGASPLVLVRFANPVRDQRNSP